MIHAVQTFGLILVELLVLFSLISVLVALVNRRFGPDRIFEDAIRLATQLFPE